MCGQGQWITAGTAGAQRKLKWTEEDFADYDQGRLPMGHAPDHGRMATWTRDSRMRR